MLSEIYTKLLDMSLQGSIVILAVMLLRLLFFRLPKAFSYFLWAVVLFRLLCPVSIEAPVSMIPRLESVSESYTLTEEPISFVSAGVAAYEAVGDALNGGLGVQHIHTENTDEYGFAETVTASWWEVWVLFGQYLWLIGLGGFCVYGLVAWLRLRRKLTASVRLQDNIYLVDHIPMPFVLGLFRPKIYLPSDLKEEERIHILAHEQHHIRRGDHVAKLLAFAALALHWLNPLVWVAYILFCKDMEMSCDEAVLRKLGPEIRGDYAVSLLRIAAGKQGVGIMPLAFGEGDAKDRIKNLARWKKPALWLLILCGAVIAVVSVCLLTDPTPQTDAPGTAQTETQRPQPGGTSVSETFETVLCYAGYTAEAAFYAAADNSDTFAQSMVLHLPIYKFDTKEQLDDFIGTYGKFLSLNQSYDDVPSFYGAAERFDDGFFRENTLMLVYIQSSSGSNRYGVDSIYCSGNAFCVHIKRINDPQGHTYDMAGWFMLVGVPDSMLSGVVEIDADLDATTAQGSYLPLLQSETNTLTGMTSLRGNVRKTDLYGLSQKVKDAVANEWKTYDMLTPEQHALSSHLFGAITFRADTWQQAETDLGLQIKNPVADVSWLTPTDVYGGIATDDEILHTETDIYAMDANERTVEQISVSAGYRGAGQRVILKATLYGEHTLILQELGDAEVDSKSLQTGSGMAVLVIRDSGEKYTAAEGYWVDQNVMYKLRVIGEPGQETQVREVLQKLLEEI